jgi:hypothetical protein
MLPDPRYNQLRQEIFRLLADAAHASATGLTLPQRTQVEAAVWNAVDTYLRARPRRSWSVLRTILKRTRQGLYGLGAAGTGVTLTATVTGTLRPSTLAAAFLACLAVLLAGLVIELLEDSLEV